MNKRKLFALLLCAITSLSMFSGSLTVAIASPISDVVRPSFTTNEIYNAEDTFNQSYIAVENLNHTYGGYIKVDNYSQYLDAAAPGIIVAETLTEASTSAIDGYSLKLEALLHAYKKASEIKLDTFYNKNDYSETENGILAIDKLKAETISNINGANVKSEIDGFVSGFQTQINEGNFSKNRNVIQTTSDSQYAATVVYAGLVFSDDSNLLVKEVKNGILIKNTQLSLLDNENTIETGGVALYLNFVVKEDGIVNETVYDEPITFAVSVESTGLTIENGQEIQIAKYNGKLRTELITAEVVDGYIVFAANSFGEYAIVLAGYELQNRSEFAAFWSKYWVIAVVGVVVILIIAIPISAARKERKKREQREFKEFKKRNRRKNKKEEKEELKRKRKQK